MRITILELQPAKLVLALVEAMRYIMIPIITVCYQFFFIHLMNLDK
jgi:hypothetical protein